MKRYYVMLFTLWIFLGLSFSNVNAQETHHRSDQEIINVIKNKLGADPQISAHLINIKVDNGKVILRGSVYNRALRTRVQDIVENVEGVESIVNNIKISSFKMAELNK